MEICAIGTCFGSEPGPGATEHSGLGTHFVSRNSENLKMESPFGENTDDAGRGFGHGRTVAALVVATDLKLGSRSSSSSLLSKSIESSSSSTVEPKDGLAMNATPEGDAECDTGHDITKLSAASGTKTESENNGSHKV
jgi:hypothetical protein